MKLCRSPECQLSGKFSVRWETNERSTGSVLAPIEKPLCSTAKTHPSDLEFTRSLQAGRRTLRWHQRLYEQQVASRKKAEQEYLRRRGTAAGGFNRRLQDAINSLTARPANYLRRRRGSPVRFDGKPPGLEAMALPRSWSCCFGAKSSTPQDGKEDEEECVAQRLAFCPCPYCLVH